MSEHPHAEMVRMVRITHRGRTEIMPEDEAHELRAAIGRALAITTNDATTIMWATADEFNLSPKVMMADRRDAVTALCRQTAMSLLRELTSLSFDNIGELFPREKSGKARDHGTVLHACRRIAKKAEEDPTFRERLERLRNKLAK